jgi:hypothetical protein
VPQAEWLFLAHVAHRGQLGDGLDLGQLVQLSTVPQVVLELERLVEVILDRTLVAAGDNDDLGQAGGHRLLDHVLDCRLVHQGQHFLGLCLGGGQKSRAEPGRGEDGLAYAHWDAPIRVPRSGASDAGQTPL